jgi:hypothetical protein
MVFAIDNNNPLQFNRCEVFLFFKTQKTTRKGWLLSDCPSGINALTTCVAYQRC